MADVELYNATTLKVEAKSTDEIKYILGARYRKGGSWLVPVSQYRRLAEFRHTMPQALLGYCRDMEAAYIGAQTIIKEPLDGTEAFLLRHQKVAKQIAIQCPRFAFFLDTGTGKTLAMLSVMNYFKDMHWLVVCPKAIMRTAWRDDAKTFYPKMQMAVYDKDLKKEDIIGTLEKWGHKVRYNTPKPTLFKAYVNAARLVVMNPEQFKINARDLESQGFDGLIIDESTTIKTPGSQISKSVYDFSDKMQRVYILSGEPAPNGIQDYYAQMRVIDAAILGGSFTAFKHRYFNSCGYMGYDLQPKPGSAETIASKLNTVSYVVKKEDCLDLPPKTYVTKQYALSMAARKAYKVMLDDFLAMAGDDMILAPNKVAAIMKLRQITSGFILDGDGIAWEVHNSRLQLLQETLEEIGKHQVIIWCQFREEIRHIQEMLEADGRTVCTAYGGTKDINDSIDGFKSGKYQYICAHPQSAKFGITFTNCSYAVYYSYSYNYEDYYQSHDRIYRYGQKVPCTFIRLEATGTIDEVMWQAVQQKQDNSQFLSSLMKHIEGR